jgi:hypothetical protein
MTTHADSKVVDGGNRPAGPFDRIKLDNLRLVLRMQDLAATNNVDMGEGCPQFSIACIVSVPADSDEFEYEEKDRQIGNIRFVLLQVWASDREGDDLMDTADYDGETYFFAAAMLDGESNSLSMSVTKRLWGAEADESDAGAISGILCVNRMEFVEGVHPDVVRCAVRRACDLFRCDVVCADMRDAAFDWTTLNMKPMAQSELIPSSSEGDRVMYVGLIEDVPPLTICNDGDANEEIVSRESALRGAAVNSERAS